MRVIFALLLVVVLALAVLWIPMSLVWKTRTRLRATENPVHFSVFRALFALGVLALVHNLIFVIGVFTAPGPIEIPRGGTLISALILVWASFWGRLILVRIGRKRRTFQH